MKTIINHPAFLIIALILLLFGLVASVHVFVVLFPWPSSEEVAHSIGSFVGEIQKAADDAASKSK